MTGMHLRLQRVRKRVKAKDLATRMGVLPPRVSQVEMLAVVTDEMAERYLKALATFEDVAEPSAEAIA